MNCSNKFKLSLVASTVLAAMNVNAALYQVVEVVPTENGVASEALYKESYGVAIAPLAESDNRDQGLGCFTAGSDCSDFQLAGETRITTIQAGRAADGIGYREEVPFGVDRSFNYLDPDWSGQNGFESYCFNQLEFTSRYCEGSWAPEHYNQWIDERTDSVIESNAIAFVEGNSTPMATGGYNTIINALAIDEANGSIVAVGNRSVFETASDSTDKLSTRNLAYLGDVDLVAEPEFTSGNNPVELGNQSRVWANKGQYSVGSVSHLYRNDAETEYSSYSRPAIWDGETVRALPWPNGIARLESDGDFLAQGSIRDFTVKTEGGQTTIYAVGYNSYDSDYNFMNATVFKAQFDSASSAVDADVEWTVDRVVSGAQVTDDNDTPFTTTKLVAMNDNGIAVGEAKQRVATDGALPNRLFIVNDLDNPSASYLGDNIFFSNAGGQVGAINNYNELVGQVDAEQTREVDGVPRRKRAFINPLDHETSDETRRNDLFNNQSWLLDNLTNGETVISDTQTVDFSAANNAFRIIDATDINDAGVISATALKCEGGYDNTSHNSVCGGGSTKEQIVAVKLIPIPGATAENIISRGEESEPVSRSGGSLGWLSLTLLALFSLRRKK